MGAVVYSVLMKNALKGGDFTHSRQSVEQNLRWAISLEEQFGGHIKLNQLLRGLNKAHKHLKAYERLETVAPKEEIIRKFAMQTPTDASIDLVNFMFDHLESGD